MPPFSGKKKKKQLQEKRQKKKQQDGDCINLRTNHSEKKIEEQKDDTFNMQEEYKYGADRKGIRSVFRKETREEIAMRKKLLYEPLKQRNFIDNSGILFGSWFNMPGDTGAALMPFSVEIPLRGWACDDMAPQNSNTYGDCEGSDSYGSSSNNTNGCEANYDVEAREKARFEEYLNVLENYPLPSALQGLQLNLHERNLDVWRQLWRTVEQSDVVVIVADVRYTILHLPLSLLYYVVRQCKKLCLVVLNKADLVPKPILNKWVEFLSFYFRATGIVAANEAEEKLSGVASEIPLLPFTSLPVAETAFGAENSSNVAKRRKKNKRHAKLYEQLRTGKLQITQPLYNDACVDDSDDSGDGDEDSDDHMAVLGREDVYAKTDNFKGMQKAEFNLQSDKRQHKELQIVSEMISTLLQKCRNMCVSKRHAENNDRVVTDECEKRKDDEKDVHIGFVGHPNVGKSSLLNCIRGTKVVSTSSTAGHTKHMQTILILSERVVLIDSPGIVFPVFGMPPALQAVIGTHQIAQTRDPQGGVAFLASHLPLERLYGLRKVDDADETAEWSPYELCESYAKKRGYFVKRGKGALDVHRGSIEILQDAYEGRLVLFFAPPDVAWLESDEFRERVAPYLLLPVHLPNKREE